MPTTNLQDAKSCCLYTVTNSVNSRVYVGISVDPRDRWRHHIKMAARGEGYGFHEALRKYGPDKFIWRIEYCCSTPQQAKELEVVWIHALNSDSPGICYNQTPGGDYWTPTPEIRAKISAAHRGKIVSEYTRNLLRKPFSAERKANISAALKGKKRSLEARQKQSAATKGKRKSPEHIAAVAKAKRGKPMSNIARQNISKARKAYYQKLRNVKTEAGK